MEQRTFTRVWAPRGWRPAEPRDQRRNWAHLFGARGSGAAPVPPFADAAMTNPRLAETGANVSPGALAGPLVEARART